MFKFLSVYWIFHFQRTCICPSFSIIVQNTLKVVCLHLDCVLIFPCLILSKWNVDEKATWSNFDVSVCFESFLQGEIYSNFTQVKCFKFTHTIAFQSVLHDNSKTWADAGPLKVKYLVSTGKFKCNLKSDPLLS